MRHPGAILWHYFYTFSIVTRFQNDGPWGMNSLPVPRGDAKTVVHTLFYHNSQTAKAEMPDKGQRRETQIINGGNLA